MKAKTPKIYLGIDWGARKIGLAVGDDFTNVAVPFKIVKNLKAVLEIIKKEGIDGVVLGEPLTFANKHSQQYAEFKSFLDDLRQNTKLPIELVDERLSTRLANSLGYDKKLTVRQNKKNKPGDDAVAAMLILQSYFDSHNT